MRSSESRLLRGNAATAMSLVLLITVGLSSIPVRAADSPVIAAAKAGELAKVEELIASGADVNVAAADGSTALLWAAYQAYPEMVAALLTADANPNAANNYGVTPLLQASRTGDAAVMQVLLDGGADILIHSEEETVLMAASRTGRMDAVRLLLEHGADPNATDPYQRQTALMWAAAEGHLDVVNALLDAGADPNLQAHISALTERKNADYPSGGFTALMWAARNGYEDIVRRLAEAGANLDMTNGDGATAMMMAVVNDRFDMARTLVELGANVNDGSLYHAVEMRDATTDWYARDGSKLRNNFPNELTALDLIALLLDAGADPNQPYIGQMHSATMCCDTYANGTATYRAAVAADVEAIKLLIAHGGDVNWSPSKVEGAGGPANGNVGLTTVMVAMKGGRGVPLSAGPGFSRQGPPPFREPSNRTPADAVRLLLAAGADADALNPDGNAALHEAVKSRKTDLILALAEGGATLDLPNKDGHTPLYLAVNAEPDKDNGPFGPKQDRGEATPEQVVDLMRDLLQKAGIPIESQVAASSVSSGDAAQ